MARIRRTSMEALQDKIEKAQTDVSNAKRKYDEATAALKKLLDKRDALRKEELITAVTKSTRTYEEIMAFLQSDSPTKEVDNK